MLPWKMAVGGPHHYGSETVWPGKSHVGERSAGPRGHSRYALLSYCREGRWERVKEADRKRRWEQMQQRTDGQA